jgi:hypothetical protein
MLSGIVSKGIAQYQIGEVVINRNSSYVLVEQYISNIEDIKRIKCLIPGNGLVL